MQLLLHKVKSWEKILESLEPLREVFKCTVLLTSEFETSVAIKLCIQCVSRVTSVLKLVTEKNITRDGRFRMLYFRSFTTPNWLADVWLGKFTVFLARDLEVF